MRWPAAIGQAVATGGRAGEAGGPQRLVSKDTLHRTITILTIGARFGIDLGCGGLCELGAFHMPGDPKECREHAKRCWALAFEVTNPVLKESLMDTAQRWSRLAADLKAMHVLLEEWRQEDSTDAKKAG